MPRSDCASAQSDLGLRCPHMPRRHIFTQHYFFCVGFCVHDFSVVAEDGETSTLHFVIIRKQHILFFVKIITTIAC